MKKIFAVIMVVFACLAVNAQEVHGYGNAIAKKLETFGFTIDKSGYDGKVSATAKSDTYEIMLTTPQKFGVELTRLAIEDILKQYSDVRLYQPWKIVSLNMPDFPSAMLLVAVFLCDDTALVIDIADTTEVNDNCVVCIYETIVGEY